MNTNSKKRNVVKKMVRLYLLSVLIFSLVYTSIPAIPTYAAERVFTLDLGTISGADKLILYPDRLEVKGESPLRDKYKEQYEVGDVLFSKNTSEFDILELVGSTNAYIFVVGGGGDSSSPTSASNCTIRLNSFTGSNLYLGEMKTAYNGSYKYYNINVELIGSNAVNNMYLGASGGTVTLSGSGSLTATNTVSLNNLRRYGSLASEGFATYFLHTGSNETATLVVNNTTLTVTGDLLCTQTGSADYNIGVGTPAYRSGASMPAKLIQNGGFITAKRVLCGYNAYGNQRTSDGGTYIQNSGFMKCTELSNSADGTNSNYAGNSGVSKMGGKGGSATINGDGVLVERDTYSTYGKIANGGLSYPNAGDPGANSTPAINGMVRVNRGYFSGDTDAQILDTYGIPVSKVTLKLNSLEANKKVNVTINEDTIWSYTDDLGWYVCYLPVSRTDTKASITVEGRTYRGIFKPTTDSSKNIFTLTRGDNSTDSKFKPIILGQSDDTKYYVGQTLSLFVNAKSSLTSDTTGLKYEWEKNSKVGGVFQTIPNSNTSNYKEVVTEDSNGMYRCKVMDKDGSFIYSNNIAVTIGIRPPVIVDQSQNSNVHYGEDLTLFVNAKSAITNDTVNLNYSWEKQDANGTFLTIPNTNSNTYQQKSITESNAGVYRCKITDKDGSFTYSLNITATFIKKPPVILDQNQNSNVHYGEDLTLFVNAKSAITNDIVNLKYSWEKQDANGTFLTIQNTNSNTYQQKSITESSAGVYRCKVIDKDGSFTYSLNITVTFTKRAPIIISQSQNTGSFVGENLSLTVNAKSFISGTDSGLTYSWEKKNVDNTFSAIPDTNKATYIQSNITEANAGTYRVKIMDKDDSFIYSLNIATTVIKRPPVILGQSSSTSINEFK